MIVSSYFPGRIRLRSPALLDADIQNAVVRAAKKFPQIHTLSVNEKTGSVLIGYDPEKVDVDKCAHLSADVRTLGGMIEFYTEQKKERIISEIGRIADLAVKSL